MNNKLFDFIQASPTAYQAAAYTAKKLDAAGYTCLSESADWELEPGRGYYISRNGSTVIAFRIPEDAFTGFMISTAHWDSPCFQVKHNAEIVGAKYVRLSVERYGGPLLPTWLDRPLGIAGRVMVRTETGSEQRLVDLGAPCCVIPNVAPHVNKGVLKDNTYNLAVDLLPMFGDETAAGTFYARVAEAAGCREEDILDTDLYLYIPDRGQEWGPYITGPRLDDIHCAFATLEGFLRARPGRSIPVLCEFDNEEVSSGTMQGAACTILPDILIRICESLGMGQAEYRRLLASSFLASCDNAQAVHPNHPEAADAMHAPIMNGGIAIKYNAWQRYITNGISGAIFRVICERAGVPVQEYANRADLPGGTTLGHLALMQAGMHGVDLGLAQLAMHSAVETAGKLDTEYLVRAMTEYFGSALVMKTDSSYDILR